jgi:hypothetical protein
MVEQPWCCGLGLSCGGALHLGAVHGSAPARWSALAPWKSYDVVPGGERGAEELVDGRWCCCCFWHAVLEHRGHRRPAWMDVSLQPSQRSPRPDCYRVYRYVLHWLEWLIFVSEALLCFCVVGAVVDVLLRFLGVPALGASIQLWAVVHSRIPGSLPSQSGEESHEQLVSEGSGVVVAAVGDVPTLPLLCLAIWEDGPLQRLQYELHVRRGLCRTVRDGVDVGCQLVGCDCFVLLSEEPLWSSWNDSSAMQDPERCFSWRRGHPSRLSDHQGIIVSLGCETIGLLVALDSCVPADPVHVYGSLSAAQPLSNMEP